MVGAHTLKSLDAPVSRTEATRRGVGRHGTPGWESHNAVGQLVDGRPYSILDDIALRDARVPGGPEYGRGTLNGWVTKGKRSE